jgi:hypothetical protein
MEAKIWSKPHGQGRRERTFPWRFLLIPPDIQPTTTGVHPEYDPASVLGSSAEWTSYWLADNKQQVVPPGLFPLFPCSKDSESFVAALHNNSSSLPNETRFGETGVGIISCGPGPAGLDARPFHAGMHESALPLLKRPLISLERPSTALLCHLTIKIYHDCVSLFL